MNILITIIGVGGLILLALRMYAGKPKKEDAFGSSEFLPPHEIRSLLKPTNTSFTFSKGFRGDDDLGSKNVLVVAPTGSGKTSAITSCCLDSMQSMIIVDPKSDVYNAVSGIKEKRDGFKTLVIDLDDPSISHKFNPISFVKTEDDIHDLCTSIYDIHSGSHTGGDPFWKNMGIGLLKIYMKLALLHPDKKNHTINFMAELMYEGGEDMSDISDYIKDNVRDKKLFYEIKSHIGAESQKMRSSIFATVKSVLDRFTNPELKEMMSTTTFNFEDFRKEKTILYIRTPLPKLARWGFLITLLFDQAIKTFLAKPYQEKDQRIQFYLDEFANCGAQFKDFEVYANVIRSFGVSCLVSVQEVSQIELRYGRDRFESIVYGAFSTFWLLPGIKSSKSLQMASRLLGRETRSYRDANDGSQERHIGRDLMNPSEIRQLDGESLIITGNKKPIKLPITRYFEDPEYIRDFKKYPTLIPKKIPAYVTQSLPKGN